MNHWTVEEFQLLGHLKRYHSFRMIGHAKAVVYGNGLRQVLIGLSFEFEQKGLCELTNCEACEEARGAE